ncbi:MAG: AMP-binding protein [Bacteroidaceae bacterium]|nr:AMP-binding protein [Bacteroidaceae bacterium]MBQ9294911.1 AMP-binding protein [Bacteroidaceae bacterium]
MIDLNRVAIIAGEHSVTYSELLRRVAQFARKTPKGKQTKTVIFSENREGWVYAFFSVWQNEGVAVPVDASSTASDVAYILRDCQPDAVWVSKERETVLREAMKEANVETNVFVIDDYESLSLKDEPASSILPWAALSEPDNDDTAVIIYTSGTTGSPKGVMLSYSALKANVHSVSYDVPIYSEKRRALVLLPLHHVLPLMGSLIAPLYMGGGIAISPSLSGSDIMDTLQRGQVGIMIGVPRLWQTLFVGIKKKIDESAVARALFAICKVLGSRTLSRLVFGSVRKKMGGHIDYCVSGGAALDKEIGEGLRTLGLDVLEGYGMTETAPIIAFTRPGDYIPGCSGLPLPGVDCKLVDGELCVKGPNLMKGYYNRPEETAEVIDADGYLHTGDLAQFDAVGRVTITGRTKEIIVLSNGKNVQPSEIEYKLEKYETLVKEAAVVQDGDMLRAIIVPQPLWSSTLTDSEVAMRLKRDVLEPYNRTVSAYKKIMSVLVYRGELPRTRLEKLQRYKLGAILKEGQGARTKEHEAQPEPDSEEYRLIKAFIEQEKGVKVHAADHIETDLALDSLDKISLQDFIERTFGTSVGVDEMPAFANIEALASHVAKEKTRMEAEDVDWHQLLNGPVDNLPLPTSGFAHRFCSRLFKGFFSLYNSLKIKGQKNIPAKGACILAPNHQSFVDGPLVLAGLPWNQLGEYFFYATEEHVRGDYRRKMAAKANVIVMERANLKNSILKLAKVLREGHRVIIFPEGARTHDGGTVPFKKTFAILAHELGVPIVPVCIKGAYEALPRGSRFMRPKHIEVTYLPQIKPSAEQTYEELTRQTQNAIEEVLA